jgi:hypothetical protein
MAIVRARTGLPLLQAISSAVVIVAALMQVDVWCPGGLAHAAVTAPMVQSPPAPFAQDDDDDLAEAEAQQQEEEDDDRARQDEAEAQLQQQQLDDQEAEEAQQQAEQQNEQAEQQFVQDDLLADQAG